MRCSLEHGFDLILASNMFFPKTGSFAFNVAMAFASVLACAMNAHAYVDPQQGNWASTLQGRDLDGNASNGFEAYYDQTLDITWLADANYALTSGYGTLHPAVNPDGSMPWSSALAFASNLNIAGVTGWRLPVMTTPNSPCEWANTGVSDSICGYGVSAASSELAHMYFSTLGNQASAPPLSSDVINTGPFGNLKATDYASGTEFVPFGYKDTAIWSFNFSQGSQWGTYKTGVTTVWVVHDGDVGAASPVPEPDAIILAITGLALAGASVRRFGRAGG
jgi:hypothetical protein